MNKKGAYIGRFNPLHLGHCKVIDALINEFGAENSLVVIGSANAPLSLRHFFSYGERRNFIKKIYPNINIVGVPDFHDDRDWLTALDDILLATGMNPKETTFFGGCDEDIRFFYDDNRICKTLNRFDGTTVKVSATEVRDALIQNRPIENLIHPDIAPELKNLFSKKWELFKKM